MLIEHLMTHNGENTHQCMCCYKTFSLKDYSLKHEKSHTGEKPYQCCICDKGFPDKSKLMIHERLHTGEKPLNVVFVARLSQIKAT